MEISLTPDAQVRLIDLLADWGLWAGIAVLVLVIYRAEVGQLILSLRREGSADRLLIEMLSAFQQNLTYFKATTDDLRAIREATDRQSALLREIARDLKRRD